MHTSCFQTPLRLHRLCALMDFAWDRVRSSKSLSCLSPLELGKRTGSSVTREVTKEPELRNPRQSRYGPAAMESCSCCSRQCMSRWFEGDVSGHRLQQLRESRRSSTPAQQRASTCWRYDFCRRVPIQLQLLFSDPSGSFSGMDCSKGFTAFHELVFADGLTAGYIT